MDILALAFVALAIGAGTKTMYDYLFKVVENPKLAFDRLYIVSMLVSILLAIMTTPMIFLNVTIPTGSDFYVALTMFAYGFTANHMINRPVSLAMKLLQKQKEAESSGTQPTG